MLFLCSDPFNIKYDNYKQEEISDKCYDDSGFSSRLHFETDNMVTAIYLSDVYSDV